jgi:signal transduction histidine kinase
MQPHDSPSSAGAARDLGAAGLDDLLRELLTRIHGMQEDRARWQLLLDAVVSMAADLSLETLLERIVEIAADLAGAQYAALGVLGGPGQRLQTFITHGVGAERKREIGALPTGHGLLGLIIDRPEPLRLHDIASHPDSSGFPPHHPPMKSFLGVPVRIGDKVFGNLYLTQKLGDTDFTEQDEAIVVALAAAAGVAVENARLHREASRRERWLEATAEIAALLADFSSGVDPLQVVADKAREVAEADASWVVVAEEDRPLRLRVVSGLPADETAMRSLRLESSISSGVVRTGVPAVIEDVAEDGRSTALAQHLGWPALGPAILVPLRQASGTAGVLAIAWLPENADRQADLDPGLPASFAEQAALALQVSRSRDDRQRLALFEDRDRIARDLHDLVIQRLFAIGLHLQGLSRLADRPGEVAARADRAVDDLDETIRDIRHTIFALGTTEEGDDVQTEVVRLVDRAAATLKFRPALAFEGPVRTLINSDLAGDVLAVLQEVLSNVAKHAEAKSVSVLLAAGEEVVLIVTDDGKGFAADVEESGLRNMRHRALARGGSCSVESVPGNGTRLRWAVPVA